MLIASRLEGCGGCGGVEVWRVWRCGGLEVWRFEGLEVVSINEEASGATFGTLGGSNTAEMYGEPSNEMMKMTDNHGVKDCGYKVHLSRNEHRFILNSFLIHS
jgi:hypothetical protein